jgi:presenilin-like A22 family membrane protease
MLHIQLNFGWLHKGYVECGVTWLSCWHLSKPCIHIVSDSTVLEECTNVHVDCSENNIMFQIIQLVVMKCFKYKLHVLLINHINKYTESCLSSWGVAYALNYMLFWINQFWKINKFLLCYSESKRIWGHWLNSSGSG